MARDMAGRKRGGLVERSAVVVGVGEREGSEGVRADGMCCLCLHKGDADSVLVVETLFA